jgi:hypothetical protein
VPTSIEIEICRRSTVHQTTPWRHKCDYDAPINLNTKLQYTLYGWLYTGYTRNTGSHAHHSKTKSEFLFHSEMSRPHGPRACRGRPVALHGPACDTSSIVYSHSVHWHLILWWLWLSCVLRLSSVRTGWHTQGRTGSTKVSYLRPMKLYYMVLVNQFLARLADQISVQSDS